MSPEPSHAVVPLEPCAHSYPCSDSFERPLKSRCIGCTHNGLRAALDQAVSVRRTGTVFIPGGGSRLGTWIEVER